MMTTKPIFTEEQCDAALARQDDVCVDCHEDNGERWRVNWQPNGELCCITCETCSELRGAAERNPSGFRVHLEKQRMLGVLTPGQYAHWKNPDMLRRYSRGH